jgi:hypothetical protein
MMSDTNCLKKGIELFILTTPVSLHCYNFPIKLTLNIFLKIEEYLINISTTFEQINPSKLAKIINKAYMV